jgi:hypothetical protein
MCPAARWRRFLSRELPLTLLFSRLTGFDLHQNPALSRFSSRFPIIFFCLLVPCLCRAEKQRTFLGKISSSTSFARMTG